MPVDVDGGSNAVGPSVLWTRWRSAPSRNMSVAVVCQVAWTGTVRVPDAASQPSQCLRSFAGSTGVPRGVVKTCPPG